MNYLKAACGVLCFLVLASNVWSMSRWNEARGVYDDICYLRQAHLFQRFGLNGLDTNLARDDDHYFSSRLKEIGFADWNDPARAPCHTSMPAAKKMVIQYPPGTGFVLALFPQGFQVIPLYVLATVVTFGFALLGIVYARSAASTVLTAAFGCLATYLMINPAKSSYSVAPTMIACIVAGFLTAKLFLVKERWQGLVLAGIVGLIIGLSVNFRIPNVLLASGYLLFFFVSLLASRKLETFLKGVLFAMAFSVGLVPTLLANAINAGSPFATTYGTVDATPPGFKFDVIKSYFTDLQFVLLALAAAWIALLLHSDRDSGTRQAALVTAANLLVNFAFFLSHPLFGPYYTIPATMLSLWTLLFATLMTGREAAGDSHALRQPAKA
jgi:hypothetical protein